MKNLFKMIGIVSLAAIIGFSFTACKEENKSVPTSFRFRNQTPPANLSVARTAGPIGGTTIEEASYSMFTNYYTADGAGNLGANNKVVQKITPDTFKVYDGSILAYVSAWHNLHGESGVYSLIDLKTGATISAHSDIPHDVTATAMWIYYNFQAPTGQLAATTSFTVNSAIDENHEWRLNSVYLGITFSGDFKTITVPTYLLFPTFARSVSFLYTGTVYKYENQFTYNYQDGMGGGFVTPWSGYNTSGKSSVTFNVNWNMNNIIEQRCTTEDTGDHACEYCKYVIANKFWEGFSFTVN